MLTHLPASPYPAGPQGTGNGILEDGTDLRYSGHQSKLQRPQINFLVTKTNFPLGSHQIIRLSW